jgi:hypothetical protein
MKTGNRQSREEVKVNILPSGVKNIVSLTQPVHLLRGTWISTGNGITLDSTTYLKPLFLW